MRAAFGVKGARDITFRNNTVAGDLPGLAYAMRLNQEGSNPRERERRLLQQRVVRPHGHHGRGLRRRQRLLGRRARREPRTSALDRNLYWNGGAAIPPGDVLSPLVHDARRIVADPASNTNHAGIVLPRWTGTAFPSGSTTIRQEFERLAAPLRRAAAAGSPAVDQADRCARARRRHPAAGRARRGRRPTSGAYETGTSVFCARRPTSGLAAGGTRLTLSGSGFLAGAAVTVGGAPAGDVFVGSGTFVKATAPALAPGRSTTSPLTNPAGPRSPRRADTWRTSSTCRARTPSTASWSRWCGAASPAAAAAGSFCPDAAVTREQMAVFLLHARRAGGLRAAGLRDPALRGRALLRAPSPRWINELAARGVTGGLRRRELLPGLRGDARADGGVPAADAARAPATRRPPASRPRSPTCRAAAGSRAGSTSSWRAASPRAAAPARTARPRAVTREQMSAFLVTTFGL